MPAGGQLERGHEGLATCLGLLGFDFLTLIENAQEEQPGQLWNILERSGAVAAAQDVTDGSLPLRDPLR